MRRVLVLLALGLLAPALLSTRARADRVRLLEDPREAMLVRAELIEGAQHEILVESFIVGDDRLTFGFLSLLQEAAARGVDVKLLADAPWNHVPGAMQAHLRKSGVEIRDYHVLRLDRLNWVAQRLHDKLLVVDGRVLLVGGRNVEAPYFGDGANVNRRNYIDCDLAIESAEAERARDYFLALWNGRHVEATRHSAFPEDRDRARRRIDEGGAWLRERFAEWSNDAALVVSSWRDVRRVRFVHDIAGGKEDVGGIRDVADELHALLRSARRDVVIESPYLIPGRRLTATLAAVQRNGASLRILTNSLATTDNLWPQAAYAGDKKAIMRSGVELWEYRGPESLHAKTMVVDGVTSVVGSFNLDPRSAVLDLQVAVIVDDEELARELRLVMDSHLESAWRIGPDGRPIGETKRHPGVSKLKILRMQLRRLWVPILRRQM